MPIGGGGGRSVVAAPGRGPNHPGRLPFRGTDLADSNDNALLVSDSGTGGDAVSILGVVVADTGTGSDAIGVLGLAGGDNGTGADSTSVHDEVAADAGTGTESVSDRAIVLTDAGAGADVVGVLGAIVGDTGTGTDPSGHGGGGGDPGSGGDVVGAHGEVAAESGAGSDTATVTVGGDADFTSPESGHGTDTSHLTIEAEHPRFIQFVATAEAPIVAEALYENLVKQYGDDLGRDVYFAMEREAKGPFGPGMKYDVLARAPQPMVVRRGVGPPPQSPGKRHDNAELKAFVRQAVTKMGWHDD